MTSKEQRAAILRILSDGRPHTQMEIAQGMGMTFWGAGLSARIRDLRKPAHGAHRIRCARDAEASTRLRSNIYTYTLLPKELEIGVQTELLPVDKST